jgi:hypothetical protein
VEKNYRYLSLVQKAPIAAHVEILINENEL